MRRAVSTFSILVCCSTLLAACGKPPQAPDTEPIARVEPTNPARRFTNVSATELLVPFYEGILIEEPSAALPEAGLEHVQLAYPGPLSAPFVAWTHGDDNWTAIYSTKLDALPAQLGISAAPGKLDVCLSCPPSSNINELKIHGSWQQVVKAVRQHWKVTGPKVRLADRFNRIDFYAHQWISPKYDPPLRVDWTIDQLGAENVLIPPLFLGGPPPLGILEKRQFMALAASRERRPERPSVRADHANAGSQ